MRRRLTIGDSTSSWTLRRAGLDRNPLRRRSDRIEAYATLVLIALFAMAAPVAAWRAGQVVYQEGAQAERIEQAERSHTSAVLLADAETAPTFRGTATVVLVRARWTAPDGTPRTGRLTASAGAPAGAQTPIWVDRAGRLTGPPQTHDQTVASAVTSGGLVALALALAFMGVRALLRRGLDRRRLADWEAAWLHTEPLWSGRRRRGPSADPRS